VQVQSAGPLAIHHQIHKPPQIARHFNPPDPEARKGMLNSKEQILVSAACNKKEIHRFRKYLDNTAAPRLI